MSDTKIKEHVVHIDDLESADMGLDDVMLPEKGQMFTNEENRDTVIAMAGSVDSGKSSLTGVLTSGELDDGNGSARMTVAKHPHEKKDGRTSDVSTRVVHHPDGSRSVLVDLCGHKKYLKTTIFGITGYFPDYGIVMVSASKGILSMTKEHLVILTMLKVPIIIVVTKVDIAPPKKYKRTLSQIKKFLSHPQIAKKPIFINNEKELHGTDGEEMSKLIDISRQKITKSVTMIHKSLDWVPVISISNKTGYYIDEIRTMMHGLKPRPRTIRPSTPTGSIFYINSVFQPPGVGLVVSGTLIGADMPVGSTVHIGPFNKTFHKGKIWSIHNDNKESVDVLRNGEEGCFAFRIADKKVELKRNQIKKGKVMVNDLTLAENTCLEFRARVAILHHQSSIGTRYTPVIHCGTICQSARVTVPKVESKDEEGNRVMVERRLKTGDSAEIIFRFVSHPEVVNVGMQIFFREGRTRGFGEVTSIKPISEDPDPPARSGRRHYFRRYRNRKTAGRGRRVVKGGKPIKVI